MNALPVLKPIDIAVVQRPKFDNRLLGLPLDWINANSETLARYYKAQTEALPFDERSDSDGDFTHWLRVQHDIELSRKPKAPPRECSICRGVHGPEITHPCE